MDFIEFDERCVTGYCNMSQLQSHCYYEIYFLLSGTRKVFLENKIFHIKANSLIVIPPLVPHKTEGGSYHRINLYLFPEILVEANRKFLIELSQNCHYQMEESYLPCIYRLLTSAAKLQLNTMRDKNQCLISFANTVIYLLSQQKMTCLEHTASLKAGRNDTDILKIVEYINQNYRNNLTLNELSDMFSICKSSLNRRFKKAVGCSAREYHSFMRLNCAKDMLLNTGGSVEEIAESCGFSSANYFSLIFKRNVGLSPRQFRYTK